MPFISVTRLRIRSIRFVPFFALDILRTRRQVQNAPGFQGGSLLAHWAWTFWTMTAWDSHESMKRYMTTGAHRTAMPHLLDWCDEASVVHWEQPEETLPSWTEAGNRMRQAGRPSKVRNPSPRHASLGFRVPGPVNGSPIRPANSDS